MAEKKVEQVIPIVNREEFRQQAALAVLIQVIHLARENKPGMLVAACKESVLVADTLILALEEGGERR